MRTAAKALGIGAILGGVLFFSVVNPEQTPSGARSLSLDKTAVENGSHHHGSPGKENSAGKDVDVSAMKMPYGVNESSICAGGLCEKNAMKYERIADVQPGYQWNDAGGYCGSWATQRAALSIGAWVSQQAVRDHTRGCGGHDAEILSCNIDEAWRNLKVRYEAFDYATTPLPQTAAYNAWLKKQLAQGRVVAWMIMWSGQRYPIYNLTPPAGMYGHVEPVVGIQSNHPLNDSAVYEDDVVLHFTDAGTGTVHRKISTLAGEWGGEGQRAFCGRFSYCVGSPYGFGWAATGFTPDPQQSRAVPASLRIDPWEREPDTRSGEKPTALKGTLTATGLTAGTAYDIYRWDSVADAFTYADRFKKASFTAAGDTYTYADGASFQSDGSTYYRVVRAEHAASSTYVQSSAWTNVHWETLKAAKMRFF